LEHLLPHNPRQNLLRKLSLLPKRLLLGSEQLRRKLDVSRQRELRENKRRRPRALLPHNPRALLPHNLPSQEAKLSPRQNLLPHDPRQKLDPRALLPRKKLDPSLGKV